MTRACDLGCDHCAGGHRERDPGELTTDQGRALMDDVARMGSQLVLTGGDPLRRPDLFELLAHAQSIGLPVAVTLPPGPRLHRDHVMQMRRLGVSALAMGIDGPHAHTHDTFRGAAGSFGSALSALKWAREQALSVQVNTLVTGETLRWLPDLYRRLISQAPPVRRWSLFIAVNGASPDLTPPAPDRLQDLWEWLYEVELHAPFRIATVEGPHFRRHVLVRRAAEGADDVEIGRLASRFGFGLRGGNGSIHVTHTGEVRPSGFLPFAVGHVRRMRVSEIYRGSRILRVLRDADQLSGRCGSCPFRWACGGSRARAWLGTGDLMGADPSCGYRLARAA